MSKEISGKREYNYSIAFMKAFLSFCVVCVHFLSGTYAWSYPLQVLQRMAGVAVSVFVIVSFYLSASLFKNTSFETLKKRIRRLITPLWGWGLLYFCGFFAVDFFAQRLLWPEGMGFPCTWKDLALQLVLGSSDYLCPPLWYLFDLIVLDILFYIIYIVFKKRALPILALVGVIAFCVQYLVIYEHAFEFLYHEIRIPLVRLAEVLPMAVLGVLLTYGVMEKLKGSRFFVIVGCIILMHFSGTREIFTNGNGYQRFGGAFLVVYSLLAFVLFFEMPFERLPGFLKNILVLLSKLSLGVYCLHWFVGCIWRDLVCRYFGLEINTLKGCVVIYLVSLLLAWLISLIPNKYAKQLVE